MGQHACPGCGEIVPSLWGSIVHCDPSEPVDDLDDTVVRGID